MIYVVDVVLFFSDAALTTKTISVFPPQREALRTFEAAYCSGDKQASSASCKELKRAFCWSMLATTWAS